MNKEQHIDPNSPGSRIRAFRGKEPKMTLDELAEKIGEFGCPKPSAAKLSRIESCKQPVPSDILPALSQITGISRRDLRPDLVELLSENGAAA
jgi:transcriptional regulator with XRE-family HTH domain